MKTNEPELIVCLMFMAKWCIENAVLLIKSLNISVQTISGEEVKGEEVLFSFLLLLSLFPHPTPC